MSAEPLQVGDVGVSLQLPLVEQDGATPLDVSAATDLWVFLSRPRTALLAADVVTRVGRRLTDGTDGVVEYVTEAGDLDRPGRWKVQAAAEFGQDKPVYSRVASVRVLPNLAEAP